MEHISIDTLHDLVSDMGEDELVLDVRTDEEWEEGHIKGARLHPHDDVVAIADELKKYKKVYVHCKMGGRAQRASEALTQSGLDNIVCVSQGGMQRWMDMGWETE